jgi:hypothetical protein
MRKSKQGCKRKRLENIVTYELVFTVKWHLKNFSELVFKIWHAENHPEAD